MLIRRTTLGLLTVVSVLAATQPATAQIVYPPAPERYDVQLRYRIRATRDQRIVRFEALAKHLSTIGFSHTDEKAFELDLLDPAAEIVTGTIGSADAPKLLANEDVKTVLLSPAGVKSFDDPKKVLQLRIELTPNLIASDQKLLHGQAAEQLGKLGFIQAVGYDHRGYTRLRGAMPAGNVSDLLKDLRGLPAGWFVGGSERDSLPLPIRAVLPIRTVTVLSDVPEVPPAAQADNFGKLTADLNAYVNDPTTADKPLVVEVVLETDTSGVTTGTRAAFRTAIPGVGVEGFAGTVVTLRLPRAALLKNVADLQDVRHIRLPRPGTETVVDGGGKPSDFVTTSRVNQLHRLGYTGDGTTVAVIASEFPGFELKVEKDVAGKEFSRVTIAGVTLPPGSYLFDLTGEVNPTLEPKPVDQTRGNGGTAATLAVHAAAPTAPLVLVRVDPSRFHQLLTVARAVTGTESLSTAMLTRADEVSVRGAVLESRRKAATAEFQQAFANLRDDERSVKRRAAAAAEIKALQAEEADHQKRLDRFLTLKNGLESLSGMSVVVNTLVWEAGYPHDGISELSRLIESAFTAGADVSAIRANKKAVVRPVWVQAASTAVGRAWTGPFLDTDSNGVMEFTPAGMPVPAKRWSRELNFLGYSADGKTDGTVPAGTKLRITIQWREPHNPDVVLPAEPTHPLDLRLYRQIDPLGKTVASDELAEVARSTGETVRLYKSAGSGVYEAMLETVIAADGVYALRVERGVAGGDLPPAARVAAELRPRIFVELTDPAQAAKGQVILDTYAVQNSGVGIPGDSPAAVTIGVPTEGDPTKTASLTGVGPGVALGVKPDLLADGSITVGGKTTTGTGVAAGFAGGVAACLMGAGAKPADLIKSVRLKPGSQLILPDEWVRSLTPKASRSLGR
jgi:hypothetical protein